MPMNAGRVTWQVIFDVNDDAIALANLFLVW